MAATTAGALTAHIEGLGLGLAAYRDKPPPGTKPKYVQITEMIALTLERHGDYGDTTADTAAAEQVQLDLYEWARDPNDSSQVAESYTLRDQLVASLHGARLPMAPTHVYGVSVLSATRFPLGPEDDTNVIRTLIQLSINRRLSHP